MTWKICLIIIIISNIECKPNKAKNAETSAIYQKQTDSSSISVKESAFGTEFPYLDSLKVLFKNTHDVKYLSLLEKEALHSDGSKTTELGIILSDIFDADEKVLIQYIIKNKSIRLRKVLIDFWSENLSTYQGEDRKSEIKKFKDEMILLTAKQKLSNEEKSYLVNMLNEIKPSNFD